MAMQNEPIDRLPTGAATQAVLRHMLATEVARFFEQLATLDRELETLVPGAAEPVIQGPLADALTHVGQLSMLRGMAGAPVRPESYARAEIVAGRTGREQAASKKEFDGDASAR